MYSSKVALRNSIILHVVALLFIAVSIERNNSGSPISFSGPGIEVEFAQDAAGQASAAAAEVAAAQLAAQMEANSSKIIEDMSKQMKDANVKQEDGKAQKVERVLANADEDVVTAKTKDTKVTQAVQPKQQIKQEAKMVSEQRVKQQPERKVEKAVEAAQVTKTVQATKSSSIDKDFDNLGKSLEATSKAGQSAAAKINAGSASVDDLSIDNEEFGFGLSDEEKMLMKKQLARCWRRVSDDIDPKNVIKLNVVFSIDGRINAVNILNTERFARSASYRNDAQITKRAILDCALQATPSKNRYSNWREVNVNFGVNLVR